jgi:signal transduction histidine kinase
METWVNLSKALVLIYCIYTYISGIGGNYSVLVLLVLVYISINLFQYVMIGKRIRKMLILCSALILIASTSYLNSTFILILPLNIYEIFYEYEKHIPVGLSLAAILISCVLVNVKLIPLYLLISAFSYIIYKISFMAYGRIKKLNCEIDRLRNQNQKLNKDLGRDVEFKTQLRYLTQLEERNKIAQEIHDNIGHTLAGSLMQLEAAKLLIDNSSDMAKQIVQNTIDVLRNGMENVRATLINIKPPAQQMGINRIKLLLHEFSARNNIKNTLVYKGDIDLIGYSEWKVIYENATEALTNILKYSRATTVAIHIEVLNKLIKCEIKDNGIGTFSIKKGLGLKGIEERCEELGGKVILDGSEGFSIIVLLPLPSKN